MILSYGNVDYKNIIISLSDWAALNDKLEISPFGQLPSIKLTNGTVIAQTAAIVRYVAKLAGLYPSNPEECAEADMLLELAQDMNVINPLLNYYPVVSEDFKRKYGSLLYFSHHVVHFGYCWKRNIAEYFSKLPTLLKAMEKILGGKKFFGGESPYYADFSIFNILYNTIELEPKSLDDAPTMIAWMESMKSLPTLKKYLAERPNAPDVGIPGSYIVTKK